MKVRPVAMRSGMSVYMVTVLLVVSPHHPRLVRAFFVTHMGIAHTRVHSQDGGRGDRATRVPSATRASNGLLARLPRLSFRKVAAAVTSVRVERHVLLLFEGRLMLDSHLEVPRKPGAAMPSEVLVTP